MRSGRLRNLIVLQSEVESGRDSMGGSVSDWVDETPPIPAEIDPVGGRKFFAALQEHSEDEIIFHIRYHPRVDTTWRVIWESRAYDIEEIKEGPNARHVEQYLRCKTQQNAEA